MRINTVTLVVLLCWSVFTIGCGGRQSGADNIDIRPLEEVRAAPIIEEVLAERGYSWDKKTDVKLTNGTRFSCDYQTKRHGIAIEFLTAEDRRLTGPIPPPAEGSRLHVVPGLSISPTAPESPSPVYVFFIDARKFQYHVNPTSDVRADVTFLEVDSRLRRDLADFISWYEASSEER